MEALKPEDPSRIGPFTPLARIGAGGMGRVYLARSRGGRPLAVKVIRAEYAEDERFRSRFRREVDAARTVDGMYTASVLDAGTDDDEPWLATAYIPGPSLQRVVYDHGPLPERSARVLGAGIAEALGAIHGAGLIHRDLKPSNVICGPDGPRVIDFGISHAVGGSSLTATGVVVGSPRYASPEQCRTDEESSPASDIFALGGVLVYATTGVPPFGDGPDHIQLYLVVHEKPDLTGVPMGLRPIVGACLEKNPADRPSIDELLDTLLPPDDAGALGDVDWLPEAVHRDMRKYAAVPVAAAAEESTHERPDDDPVRTPAPRDGGDTDVSGGSGTGGNSGSDATSASSASLPDRTPHLGRRRVLTGIAGVVAMAASGGGAWYAATRGDGKKTAQNAGATLPPGTPSSGADSSATVAPTGSPSASTPSSSASETPSTHSSTGKWGEDWASATDLGGAAGGAVVRGGRLIGVYTASTNNPVKQQSLIALDTTTGHKAWDPVVIPGVDAVTGAGIVADDQYVYSYGAGTIYAWNLSDGKAAWNAKSGLAVTTADNNMPATGILGLVGGILIIGSANFDPSYPPSLAGFDVAARVVAWTKKTTDLLDSLPAGLTVGSVTAAVSVPQQGNLFYVTLSDQTSLRVLKGMDPQKAKQVWSVPFTSYSDNAAGTIIPTVTGTEQHVYLTDMHSGSVHAYDTGGNWMWTYPNALGHTSPAAEKRVTGPVVESGDTVYVTNANSVIALQASSKAPAGTPLWKNPRQFNGLAGAPAAVGDKVWVEVHTPTEAVALAMAVLNGADGQPVQQYPMPEGPTASSADLLVRDPAGGGVYVLTASGQVLGYRRTQ
jgi:serine/threonine protein kinase